MKAIKLEQKNNTYLISIAQGAIDKEILARIVARLRLEYLLKKAAFDESVEELDEDIKTKWWERNQARIMQIIKSEGSN